MSTTTYEGDRERGASEDVFNDWIESIVMVDIDGLPLPVDSESLNGKK